MTVESTYVFSHADETEARRVSKELFERYPFGGDGATCTIACGRGDSMSVHDAIRAAMECRALDFSTERGEFALAMCECLNWEQCMALAAEWELRWIDGDFVDMRAASAGEAGTAETAKTGSVHEHAVGEAETPVLDSPSQGEGE
jgi:hypothetical protein